MNKNHHIRIIKICRDLAAQESWNEQAGPNESRNESKRALRLLIIKCNDAKQWNIPPKTTMPSPHHKLISKMYVSQQLNDRMWKWICRLLNFVQFIQDWTKWRSGSNDKLHNNKCQCITCSKFEQVNTLTLAFMNHLWPNKSRKLSMDLLSESEIFFHVHMNSKSLLGLLQPKSTKFWQSSQGNTKVLASH